MIFKTPQDDPQTPIGHQLQVYHHYFSTICLRPWIRSNIRHWDERLLETATEVDNDIIESAMQYEKRRVSKHTTETKRNECISNHTAKNKKECVVCVRKIATIA